MIIRGVNVFPSQIEGGPAQGRADVASLQIVLTRKHGLDQMEVQIEVTAENVPRPCQRAGTVAGRNSPTPSTCDRLRVEVRLVNRRRFHVARAKRSGSSINAKRETHYETEAIVGVPRE